MKFTVSVKNRREYCDYDYLDRISMRDRKWLWRFNQEYLNANFLNPGKSLIGKSERKQVWDMNNARNRDLYSRLFNKGLLWLCAEVGSSGNKITYSKQDLYEDYLIAAIDNSR